MIRNVMSAVLVAALATSSGRAADEPPAPPFDDAAFVKAIAVGGRYDVALCDLVGSQTRNADVRKYAACVVAGHLRGSAGLKAVAKEAGIELPAGLDGAHRERFEAFKEYKGDDLDRDFVRAMVRHHTASVALCAQASKEAKHPAVKALAAKALPVFQQHLEAAKGLDK